MAASWIVAISPNTPHSFPVICRSIAEDVRLTAERESPYQRDSRDSRLPTRAVRGREEDASIPLLLQNTPR